MPKEPTTVIRVRESIATRVKAISDRQRIATVDLLTDLIKPALARLERREIERPKSDEK